MGGLCFRRLVSGGNLSAATASPMPSKNKLADSSMAAMDSPTNLDNPDQRICDGEQYEEGLRYGLTFISEQYLSLPPDSGSCAKLSSPFNT